LGETVSLKACDPVNAVASKSKPINRVIRTPGEDRRIRSGDMRRRVLR
jgi:hypothetical protein